MTHKSNLLLALIATTLCQVAHAKDYVAEGYFVLDNKVVENYISQFVGTGDYSTRRTRALAAVQDDMDYFLTQVSERFSGISRKGSLSVEIRVRALQILDQDTFSSTSVRDGRSINRDTALSQFGQWLQAQAVYTTLKYDFAILLTGYDLTSGGSSWSTGLAHTGRVCDPRIPVAVVENNATYVTAETATHEIAHLLGSSHDGKASQYLMASSNQVEYVNRSIFSDCSISDIKDYMDILEPNCLLTTSPESYKPNTTLASYKGQLLDPEVTCHRKMNDTRSYVCKSSGLYDDQRPRGDILCLKIYCHITGTDYCRLTRSPEGMVCDVNKRCHFGKCVVDTDFPAKHVDGSCVLGDQKELEISSIDFKGNCSEYIALQGARRCYNDYVNNICCETCNKHKTDDPSCPYGDRSSTCADSSKESICPRHKDHLCCGYCRGFVGKRSIRRRDRNVTIELLEDIIIPDMEVKEIINVQEEIQNTVDY